MRGGFEDGRDIQRYGNPSFRSRRRLSSFAVISNLQEGTIRYITEWPMMVMRATNSRERKTPNEPRHVVCDASRLADCLKPAHQPESVFMPGRPKGAVGVEGPASAPG